MGVPGVIFRSERWHLDDVEAREFARAPNHWFLTSIRAGDLLAPIPWHSPMWADPYAHPKESWSVWRSDGGKNFRPVAGIPADVVEQLERLDRVAKDPRYSHVLSRLPAEATGVSYVERDMPAAGIRAGDLLVRGESPNWPEIPGVRRELRMEDYEAVRATMREGDFTLLTDYNPHRRSAAEFFRQRNRWGRRLKVWRSRILHVRPVRPSTATSIEAPSDEAALFELLAQSGGRMPTGRGRDAEA